MKNLFTIIVILTPLWILSQTTDITKAQQKRINKIFTSDKIIDISKAISNEQRQKDSIFVLQEKIKELKNLITEIKEEHLATITEIAKINAKAKETTLEVDEISEEQLKKERFKWAGLHLYGGVEAPRIRFTNLAFNSELMYELEKIEFGIKLDLNTIQAIDTENYQFNYHLKLRYKFF